MSFGSRMKELREYRKLNREDMAKRLNITKPTISNWETDKTFPELSKFSEIMDILGCDANYLLQDWVKVDPITFTTSIDEQKLIRKYRKLKEEYKKLVEFIINYLYKLKEDRTVSKNEKVVLLPEVFQPEYNKSKYYLLFGKASEPLFKEGDIISIKNADRLSQGEIGLFEDKENNFSIKKFYFDRLEPINPDFDIVDNIEDFKIVGKVQGKVNGSN